VEVEFQIRAVRRWFNISDSGSVGHRAGVARGPRPALAIKLTHRKTYPKTSRVGLLNEHSTYIAVNVRRHLT
jgi:hypothetical protein